MLFPIGDTPNPKGYFPFVNWALIVLNALVYVFISWPQQSVPIDLNSPLLMDYLRSLYPSWPSQALAEVVMRMSQYDLFIFEWGYKAAAPELRDLFASMFLHANFLHLGSNLLFLWIFGDNVEYRLGRLGYLLVYLLSGVAATLSFSVLALDSMVPMVGASGAISGVLGMYFLLFPRNKVKIFVFFIIYIDVWLLPVRWVLAFFVLFDNLLPLLAGNDSGVAHGAHLGGFLAGLLFAMLGERLGWRWPWLDKNSRLGKIHQGAQTKLDGLLQALAQEDREQAIHLVFDMDKDQLAQLSPADCVRLAHWLQQANRTAAASQILRLCLSVHSGSSELAEVYLEFGLLRLAQGQATAAYQHLQSVFDYNPDPLTAARARDALLKISAFP